MDEIEKLHYNDVKGIVWIENGKNFNQIREQRYFFGEQKILFVSRYPQSTDLRQWLMSISNAYLHFGDFDLAGIRIYLSGFHRYRRTYEQEGYLS